MKVIIPGTWYEFKELGQRLFFMNKTTPGTTNEEVIDVLIDRINFLQGQVPCKENEQALEHLIAAREVLLSRTNKRVEQGVVETETPHVF